METTSRTLGIYDESGRYLGPAEVVIGLRPMGPWDTNTPIAAPLVVLCAWCPSWSKDDPRNATASHGICDACVGRMEQQIAA